MAVRGIINPPNMKIMSNRNEPPVYAIMMVLHTVPINLNNPDDIWCTLNNNSSCFKNLPHKKPQFYRLVLNKEL